MKLRVVMIVWFSVLSVIALEIFFPTSAGAQTVVTQSLASQEAKSEKTGTEVVFTTALRKAYIGLQGGEYHSDMVQQSDLMVKFSNGVFLSVWGSTDFTTKRNFGKEADFILGLEKYFGGLVFTIDGQYFMVKGGDIINLNFEMRSGWVFIRAETYRPMDVASGPKKGSAAVFGLSKDFNKGPFGFSFMESVRYDSGAFGYEPAWIHRGYMGLSLDMNDTTSFMTGVTLSQPITAVKDRKREVIWEIGISRKLR